MGVTRTRAAYRQRCEENIEPWLGYCSPKDSGNPYGLLDFNLFQFED